MLMVESFLKSLIEIYGKHTVYYDGITWYLEACISHLVHRLHSSYEKSVIERIVQYLKDRTEGSDDYYYPCIKEECELEHVYRWIGLFFFLLLGGEA